MCTITKKCSFIKTGRSGTRRTSMKKQGIFSGIILIGFGLFFLSEQLNLALFHRFHHWSVLLMITGFALLAQAYYAREYQHIFSGFVLFGFGLHFYLLHFLKTWPNNIAMFLFIIAIGLLLSSQKVKHGFVQGIFFLLLACILLFYDRISQWLNVVENGISTLWKFWPLGLIFAGIYLLFMKKR